jgi:hypothetical protein
MTISSLVTPCAKAGCDRQLIAAEGSGDAAPDEAVTPSAPMT